MRDLEAVGIWSDGCRMILVRMDDGQYQWERSCHWAPWECSGDEEAKGAFEDEYSIERTIVDGFLFILFLASSVLVGRISTITTAAKHISGVQQVWVEGYCRKKERRIGLPLLSASLLVSVLKDTMYGINMVSSERTRD